MIAELRTIDGAPFTMGKRSLLELYGWRIDSPTTAWRRVSVQSHFAPPGCEVDYVPESHDVECVVRECERECEQEGGEDEG